jgi:PAS domain S-box-containing protein
MGRMDKSVRILIVEDLPTDAELAEREIRKALESCVFRLTDERGGFLEAIESFQPDIIVSDYRMPRFDGLTALKLARERVPLTPFIVLTSAINEDTAVECMKAGASDYVIKEHVKRLGQAVIHALEESRLNRQRRAAEEALRESEERYRLLFQHANDAIFLVSPETRRIIDCNEKAGELVGHGLAELQQMTLDRLYPTDEQDRVEEYLATLAGKGSVSAMSGMHFLRKDGGLVDIEVSGVRLRVSDKAVNLSVVRDVTEQKRAMEEKAKLELQLIHAQKLESVGRLAGGVAHDFNNMLSVILGYAEIIKSRLPLDDPILANILEIERAAAQSREITRQLLAFSRKQIITPKSLALNEHITETKKTLSRLIGEDMELSFHPGQDLWTIKFDPSQLDQILMNLVVNARDAMPNGGRATIETANVCIDGTYCSKHYFFTPGEYVLLEVSDEGIGMDEATLSHIFEPFFTTKEVGRGTGLGLATVYGIVKQNGGFINVYSEPGQGATFKIYFPRTIAEEAPKQTTAGPISPGSGSVLLVEDSEQVRRLIEEILDAIGYSVVAVERPSQALSLFEREGADFDLLITDVVMPEMNGVELRDRITALKPGIKVLFMSGYTANIIAHRGVLRDGVHFIQKPFSMRDIARKIREVTRSTE